MKLQIEVESFMDRAGRKRLHADVEDSDGLVLGSARAQVVEEGTFDMESAVIRAALEEGLTKLRGAE